MEPKEKKSRKERKLGTKAAALLAGLEGGERLTKREWSKKLYGDEDHTHCLYALIRTLRQHGHHIILAQESKDIGVFPPRPFRVELVKNIGSRKVMAHANGRLQQDIKTRLQTQRLMVIAIIAEYPALAGEIQSEVETWLQIILNTKLGLLNPQTYVRELPSAKLPVIAAAS
jgi:hypothetical protein